MESLCVDLLRNTSAPDLSHELKHIFYDLDTYTSGAALSLDGSLGTPKEMQMWETCRLRVGWSFNID